MRLSKHLKKAIVASLDETFGSTEALLFGSRADDTKKGGDIDIAIKTDLPKEMFKKKRIDFVVNMLKRGYDLKIDLVQLGSQTDTMLKHEIETQSVPLVNCGI